MPGIIEKIKQRIQTEKIESIQSYGDLVVAELDGTEIDALEAMQILNAANKSTEDLSADAEILLKRRTWKKQLDAVPGAKAKLEKLWQPVRKLESQVKELQTQLAEKREAILPEDGELRAVISSEDSSRSMLFNSTPEHLRIKERAVSDRLKIAVSKVRETAEVLKKHDQKIHDVKYEIRQTRPELATSEDSFSHGVLNRVEKKIAELESVLKKLESDRDGFQEAVNQAQAAVDTINSELDVITAEKMQP